MIKRFLLFLVGASAFPFIEDNKFQRKLKCFLNELVPDPLPIFAVNGLYGVDPQFDKFSLLMRIDGFNETSKKRSMMVQLLQTHEQAFQVQFQHARYLQAEPEQISSTGMVYIKTTYTHFDPLRSFRVHLLQFHEEGDAYIETQQTFDLTTYKIIYRHQQQYIVKILFITPLYHKFKGSREQIDELKRQILTQNWIECTYNQCSLNKLIVNSVKALKFQQIYPKYIKKGYLKLNDRLLPLELHNNILLGFIRQSSQLYLDINFYCQLEDRIKIDTSYLNYQGFQYYCTDYYVYKLILTNTLNDQIIDDHFNLEQENNFLAFMAFQTNAKQQLEDLFKNISYQIISGQDKQLVYQCNQIVLLIHQQLIINIDYNKDQKQPIQDLNVTNYQENNTILIQETFSPFQYQENQEINTTLTSSENNSLSNETNESPQLEQQQLNQTINKGFDTILLSLQQLINKKKHEGHKHTRVRHRKVVEPLIVDKIEVEFNVPVQLIEDQKLTISKIQVQMENEPSCEEEIKPDNEQKDNQENEECEEVEEGKETDENKDKNDNEECEEEVELNKEEEKCEEDEQQNEEKQEQEEDDKQKKKQKNEKKKDDKKSKDKKDSKKNQKNKSQWESEGEYLYDQNGNKIKNSYREHNGRDPQYQHKHHLRRRHYISKKPVFQTRYFKGDNDNKPSQYETYVGNNEQNPKFKVYYKIEDDPNVFSPFQENDDHLLQRYRHHHNDHDSSCYKFYDDCYYTGRMLEFCQNHPFMREKNMGFQIYSYYIPKGMWVRLYKQNEYDEITVQGTSQCLDDPLTLQRNFDI